MDLNYKDLQAKSKEQSNGRFPMSYKDLQAKIKELRTQGLVPSDTKLTASRDVLEQVYLEYLEKLKGDKKQKRRERRHNYKLWNEVKKLYGGVNSEHG